MDTVILKGSVTGSMTDDEFLRFCQDNQDLRIERNSNLEIIIMSPVSTLSSYSSGAVFSELAAWNKINREGVVFDSSAGFSLPDRSVLSPDASWVSNTKWKSLSEDEKNRFAPVCPEFVVEVRSKSDSLSDLKKKMHVWIANGTLLAWLIDPIEKKSYIFKKDKKEDVIDGFAGRKITGEPPVGGFILDLSLLII